MGTLSPPGRPGSRPGSWSSVATSPPWSEAWTREEGGGKLVYDLDTAEAMLKSRRHLYVVFMCHLAIEKTLKAVYAETRSRMPPRTHDLLYLVRELAIT